MAIRYRLSARPLTLYACHCTECQKQSSSAFGMSLRVPADSLEISGDCGTWIRDDGKASQSEGLCCRDCGSRIIHRRPSRAETVNIKAGTLDDTSWLQVVGHLWLKSSQHWVPIDPDLLNYDGQPENYDELIDAFSKACDAQ